MLSEVSHVSWGPWNIFLVDKVGTTVLKEGCSNKTPVGTNQQAESNGEIPIRSPNFPVAYLIKL